jgi:hypothetical protein
MNDQINCLNVRSEVFTAVIMKNAVFWHVALSRSTRHHIPEDTILNVFNFLTVSFLAKQINFQRQINVATYVFPNDISHRLQTA